MSMCKQILDVEKWINNIKLLSELGVIPLKVDIETKMFQYLQFPYLSKAFKEEDLSKKRLGAKFEFHARHI